MPAEAFCLRSRPSSGLQRTLDALPALLDGEVGLIRSLAGRLCNSVTGGTGLTEDVALSKAIGESVERYCADLYDPDEVLSASYRDVQAHATDPRRFVLFHPDQYHRPGFPYVPVTEASRLGWVWGHSLTRDEPTLVPAAMVHVPYEAPEPEEPIEPSEGWYLSRI